MASKLPIVEYTDPENLHIEIRSTDVLMATVLPAGGSSTNVQYRANDTLAGTSSLTYSSSTSSLTVTGPLVTPSLTLSTDLPVSSGGTASSSVADAMKQLTNVVGASKYSYLKKSSGNATFVAHAAGNPHIIQGNGADMTPRPALNFTEGFTVTSTADKTVVALLASTTPGANLLPMIGSNGTIALSWVRQASLYQTGTVQLVTMSYPYNGVAEGINLDDPVAITPKTVSNLANDLSVSAARRTVFIFG